jgi:hypothetical protein
MAMFPVKSNGWRREMTGSDRWDPVSARKREGRDTLSGRGGAGPWPLRWLGRNGSPEPFSIFFCSFSFSISVFLISNLSFANMLQNHSNHFQKFSKKSKYQSGTVRNGFSK